MCMYANFDSKLEPDKYMHVCAFRPNIQSPGEASKQTVDCMRVVHSAPMQAGSKVLRYVSDIFMMSYYVRQPSACTLPRVAGVARHHHVAECVGPAIGQCDHMVHCSLVMRIGLKGIFPTAFRTRT